MDRAESWAGEVGEMRMTGTGYDVEARRIPATSLERIVDLARLAPSIHNTQPWAWAGHGDLLELWADRSRSLPATDPEGRNLLLSCGATLHHALVAGRAIGLSADVQRLPNHEAPDLLARITLTPGPIGHASELVAAIQQRCTDRRRFTSWPLPPQRVFALTASTASPHARVVALLRSQARAEVERLVEVARRADLRNPKVAAETALWVDRGKDDGIPSVSVPPVVAGPGQHPHRFVTALEEVDGTGVTSTDGLAVIVTPTDDPMSWLAAGEVLSQLWLEATLDGLSVVPLSQVVEHASSRRALAEELMLADAQPQLVVRLGWQAIGRSTLPRTPRRPVNDLLTMR
jgi:hypothetical protein